MELETCEKGGKIKNHALFILVLWSMFGIGTSIAAELSDKDVQNIVRRSYQ